ncbi:MAG: response regulator [Treponema sp.]|jgi:PAS domain S-box-containing protein|nr:response regulator [Treponema sp.]
MYSVLAVDDEKANLLFLKRILSPEYIVYTVKSGAEALELLVKNKPDLILLDIVMPEMDGFEVLAELKSSPGTRDIPVIIITGLNDPNDEEKGFSLGASDYITKPFKPVVIKARVATQIKNAALMYMITDDLVRMTSIVEGSPQFMMYLGADGAIEYMNPAAALSSGYTKEELSRGGLLAPLLKADDFRRLDEEYLPGLLTRFSDETSVGEKRGGKASFSFETPVTLKNGEERFFSFSVFAAVLHNGEAGIGITAWDDTELKQMQRELVVAKEQAEYYSVIAENL